MANGTSGHGVEDVVATRQGHRNPAQLPAPIPQAETAAQTFGLRFGSPEIGS